MKLRGGGLITGIIGTGLLIANVVGWPAATATAAIGSSSSAAVDCVFTGATSRSFRASPGQGITTSSSK